MLEGDAFGAARGWLLWGGRRILAREAAVFGVSVPEEPVCMEHMATEALRSCCRPERWTEASTASPWGSPHRSGGGGKREKLPARPWVSTQI